MKNPGNKLGSNSGDENLPDQQDVASQISDLKAKIETLEARMASLQDGQSAAVKEINEAIATLDVLLEKLR